MIGMKKQLLAYLLAAACFSGSVSAAEFKTVGNSISFETQIAPKKKASMIVVKAGQSIDSNENIFAIKEATADDSGIVVFEFDMYDGAAGNLADGEYDVFVKEEGGEKVKYYLAYASESTKTAVEAELKSSVSNAVSNPANLVALKGAGFNMDGYQALADNSKIADMTEAYVSDDADSEDYAEAFNLAVAAQELNENKSAADVLKNINLSFEETSYNNIEDASLKNWIETCFDEANGFDSVDSVISMYEKSNILNIINNTRHTGIEAALDKYKSQLGIESTPEYMSYLALASKTNANAAIETSLKTSAAKTVDALKTVISSSLSAGTVVYPSGGGSTGGGGGNGGNSFPSGGITGGIPSATVNPNVSDGKFSDLASVRWAEDAINEMAKAEIVSGDGTGKFRPNDTMKREEFVKMLVLAVGKYDETAECSFADTDKNAWYYRYIASAYNSGIIYGVSDDEFGIGSELTRQDMAVICLRAAELSGELSKVRAGKEFADGSLISEYARESVQKLYMSGDISGTDENNFSPLDKATRAQGALIIYNLFLK